MNHHIVSLPLLLLFAVPLSAQSAGLRAGAHEPVLVPRAGAPDPQVAERLITVEAVAEVRVVPSQVRVVFAVSAAGTTPADASGLGRQLVGSVKDKLLASGVAAAGIDTDFVAVFPTYAWQMETAGDRQVAVERRTGCRAQYNIHVAVPDEAAVLAAVEVATAFAGIDVLAVDYWSDRLEASQQESRGKALGAAQAKAKLLLAAFPELPKIVNISETTHVLYPQQLYQTLPQTEDRSDPVYGLERVTRVPASRPQLVYYRGLFGDLDVGSAAMPGKREIHVISTVRLYYAAPERPALAK